MEDSMPDHLTINTNKYAEYCTLDEFIERGLSSHVARIDKCHNKLSNWKQNDDQCKENQRHVNMFRSIQLRAPARNYLRLKIIGLKKDALPTLKERREKATINELKRIQDDPSKPCNRFLSSAIESKYDLRRKNESIPKLLSKTDRHKMSFIPMACFNVPVSK